MPTVYRINTRSGEKTKVFIPDALWARMIKRPNVFKGQFRFELIPSLSPVKKITDKFSDIELPDSQPIGANDDLANVKPKEENYTEEKYREDLKSARLLLNAGNKKDALFIYQRAFGFRQSPYVKKQIKTLS